MKSKILKIVLIILIILIVVFTVNTMRKLNIIDNMLIAHNELGESTNYYVKHEPSEGNTAELYYKDGQFKIIITSTEPAKQVTFYVRDEGTTEIINYAEDQPEQANTYVVVEGGPIAAVLPTGISYERDTFFEKLKMAIFTSIKTEEYNGIDTYKISGGDITTWIDKDTYITVKEDDGTGTIWTYDISVNSVTDEDIEVPDLSEYTLYESNN